MLLELGNHIADIKNPSDRNKWATTLHEVIEEVLDDAKLTRQFTLVEAPKLANVEPLVRAWRDRHVVAPRGLVDAATAEKAALFKRDRSLGNPVHIWTRDRRLKGVEPDPEPDPFI